MVNLLLEGLVKSSLARLPSLTLSTLGLLGGLSGLRRGEVDNAGTSSSIDDEWNVQMEAKADTDAPNHDRREAVTVSTGCEGIG